MECLFLQRATLRSWAIVTLLAVVGAGCASTPPGDEEYVPPRGAALGGFIELDENTDPRLTHSDDIDPIGILLPAGNEVLLNGQVVSERRSLRNNAFVQTGAASGARIEFNARAQRDCSIKTREFSSGQLYGETRLCNHQLESRHGIADAPPGNTQYNLQTDADQTVLTVRAGHMMVTPHRTPDQSLSVPAGQDVVLTDRGIVGPRTVPTDEIDRRIRWRQKFAPSYSQRVSAGGPEYYGINVVNHVVFVLDVSGSMEGDAERSPTGQVLQEATRRATQGVGKPWLGGVLDAVIDKTVAQFNKLAVAKRELTPVIRKLPETIQFTVLTFANNVGAWQPNLVPANSAFKGSAVDYVKNLSSEGGTAVARALETALRIDGVQTIFFVSDGQPTDATPTEVLATVRKLNSGRHVRINTVGLGADQDRDFMSTLAAQNGGTYVSRIGGL